jgi:xylan 1,4-beta-xylosidase
VEFENPVLPGMHPDPTICRVGSDFYLACSSFEYFPGVPILHSRDLIVWRQIGHALTRRSQLDLRGVRSSDGIYAPTLRHHDGTFYLVTTLAGRGNFLVTAKHPRGPWSDPWWLDSDGIDPSLTFLDDRVYYTRNGPGADLDHPFVYQAELALSGAIPSLARRPRVIWRGTGGIWPEAPHLYRRGRWFYLLTAEGGTSYGHSVVVARSGRPYGPFVPSPHGPLLTHRNRPRHAIQATGHADLVELDDGSTWAVLLGIRPAAGRNHHLGRETFLAPVTWGTDGWPHMPPLELSMEGPSLRRSAQPTPAERDDFAARSLSPGWVFVRNPSRGSWSLRERSSCLRLWGLPAALDDVSSLALVCRRQRHLALTARTLVEFEPQRAGEQAGLCVRANEDFHVALLVGLGEDGRQLRLVRTLHGRSRTLGTMKLDQGPVTLSVEATARHYSFSGGAGCSLRVLGRVRTTALSAETILRSSGRHHFTGAMIGLVATGGGLRSTVPADFHWFEYVPSRSSSVNRRSDEA